MEQTFGERLRILRKRRGMTQGDLAQALGVSVQTMVRYESLSLEEIRPARVKKIADALGVDVSELTGADPGTEEGEESIRILTRGLRSMDPDQRDRLIRMMMPIVREYQMMGTSAGGSERTETGRTGSPRRRRSGHSPEGSR